MKTKLYSIVMIAIVTAHAFGQDGLVIQEDSLGVCTMDGIVESNAAGYTGGGYANIDNGAGIGMSWSFIIGTEGEYRMYWRYALGGSDITSRDAKLLLNNVPGSDTVLFPHSGSSSWEVWLTTDTLSIYMQEGYNKINLVSVTEKGLPNIDYFHILDSSLQATECIPSYTFTISSSDTAAGSADYSPKQELYDVGSVIAVSAQAKTGHFFHSWSGEAASTSAEHSFSIQRNTHMTALFYPEGTEADPEAIGYAVIQHDNGTPYLLNGGMAGDTVQAASLSELQTYLEAGEPYVVELGTLIQGENSEEIRIVSNKTLIGTDTAAHIKGIPVKIDGARNVIIKNITFSEVIRYDELEINGGAMNIWIDHCDFYTDREHEVDYYDGLVDIKNQSRFITVSWSKFHDHQKSILISSGDQEVADSVIRITFHHNYFFNCESRLPSIRFGKAHIFNNCYRDIGTGVNTRMGACVRVENNYFKNAGTAVGMLYSLEPGSVELIGNIFDNSGYSTEPTCELAIPYDYLTSMHPATQVPDTVILGTGGPVINNIPYVRVKPLALTIFPNPSKGEITLHLPEGAGEIREIIITNLQGSVLVFNHPDADAASSGKITLNLGDPEPGIYFVYVRSTRGIMVRKISIY
jgi:pectate lyase